MDITVVKLRLSNIIYLAHTNNLFVKPKSTCIVETEHGLDIARVIKRIYNPNVDSEIKGKLIRLFNENDKKILPQIEELEKRAFDVCKEKIKEKKLEMKLILVKSLFDKTKIIFYFVADGRIDFRELVRDLAAIFKTRIEMRQVGVRDEARMCGGFGMCGKELCCVNLKHEFEPVSIKMAKEQNMNLHSLKISGMCGRLLCCLAYEYDVYVELNKDLPQQGTEFNINSKSLIVDSLNTLKQTVKLKYNNQYFELSKNDFTKNGNDFLLKPETIERLQQSLDNINDDL